jgi:hypothetical protein
MIPQGNTISLSGHRILRRLISGPPKPGLESLWIITPTVGGVMIHDHDIKADGAFRLRLVPAAGRKLSRIAHKGLKLDPHKALP